MGCLILLKIICALVEYVLKDIVFYVYFIFIIELKWQEWVNVEKKK